MDVVAGLDGSCGKADELTVAMDGLSHSSRRQRDLVAGGNGLTDGDSSARHGERQTGRQGNLGNGHVVGGMQVDGDLLQRSAAGYGLYELNALRGHEESFPTSCAPF
jgi:hypothetical protein